MMFASDLDRTLIYSKRALEDFPITEPLDLVAVERRLEKDVSYMTKESLEYLQRVSNQLLFVPVTTRSLEQYDRVAFHHVDSKYVVTTNGANILYKGRLLADWTKKCNVGMIDSSIILEDLLMEAEQHFYLQGTRRIVENLFFYYTLSESPSSQHLAEITSYLHKEGWKVTLQGRKLYFVPEAISKGKAIHYIQEREEVTTLIGAGDSRFDDDFLRLCEHPFVLGHGELAKSESLKEHYMIIEQPGIKGGEELLRAVLALIEANGR